MGVILVLGTVLPAVLHHEDMTLSRAIFTGVGCAVGLLGFALRCTCNFFQLFVLVNVLLSHVKVRVFLGREAS